MPKKNYLRALRIAAASAIIACATPAPAGTASGALPVTATVVSSRAIPATTSIAFYPNLVVVTISF